MTNQIATLTRDLEQVKQSLQNIQNERSFNVFERQISLDVASTIRSETPAQRISRHFKSKLSVENSREIPFWKISLQEEGDEWDTGLEEWSRENLRCISPMTTY